ncbi:hypothetical protein V7S43_004583 [Phytophthora oleae]|uniref:Myb-like domain-containing protein n=1 Tax=Phytophthora oleae TaxID=2107226 RepID=A0ABD3FWZ9_9STRA
MSDFTDAEDRQLVQLARVFSRSSQQIPWDKLAQKMKCTKKPKDALRQRLKTLKRKHGRNLEEFPPWFFIKHLTTGRTSTSGSLKTSTRQRGKIPQLVKNYVAEDSDSTCSPAKTRPKLENSSAANLSPRFSIMKLEPPNSLLLLASVASTEDHQEVLITSRCT